MCFPEPDVKTPEMPVQEGADEVKSGAFKQNKKRRGYQSTLLTGGTLGGVGTDMAGESKKRLLGE